MNNYTFYDLIEKFEYIEIPALQRDYAQGRRDAEEIRSSFLSYLKGKLISEENDTLDFIYGTVDEKLQTLKAVTAEQTEPVSAAPKFDGSQFVPAREQEGTAVDMEVLAEAVRESISELALELETEFDIRIEDEELAKLETVQDIINIIEEKQK